MALNKEFKGGKSGRTVSWLKRFLALLVPSFLLCFTVIFFGPLDIISSNQSYLTFTADSVLETCTVVMAASTVVLAFLLAFFRGRAHGLVFGILLAAALMFYIQGAFLNGNLGTLDGSGFDWRDNPRAAYINIAVWGGVLLLFAVFGLVFPKQIRSVGYVACAALVIAQGVALITAWKPQDKSVPNYQLSGDEEFLLSSQDNILVLTLDQFNPLVFEQALEEDPSLKEIFKDFLYFDNMSSSYSFTFPSLCCLLTNVPFDTSIPTSEAVYNAWHSPSAEGFYQSLHDAGYRVNLFLEANYAALGAENMLGKVDNVCEAGDLVITPKFFAYVMDMSLYRYMPTMCKNPFCISTGGIVDLSSYEGIGKICINWDFYTSLLDKGLSVTAKTKMFSWYHLQGAHFPFVIGYDGLPCDEEDTSREDQLHGYLLALGTFLDEMKQLGVYDDATIIISADHGYFECFQTVGMIKLPGQTQEQMLTSSAPVSQEDIMPTILWALGEDYEEYGTTFFDWSENDRRIRTTKVWGYMPEYPEVEWVGNLDQWDAVANGTERYNVFGVFHYDGDRDTILKEERDWYYYGIVDEIEPLYDSFY